MRSFIADAGQFFRPCTVIKRELCPENFVPTPFNQPEAIHDIQRINQVTITAGIRQIILVTQCVQYLLPPTVFVNTTELLPDVTGHQRMQNAEALLHKFVVLQHILILLFRPVAIRRDFFTLCHITHTFLINDLQGIMHTHCRAIRIQDCLIL